MEMCGYSGTVRDSLSYRNGKGFSTKDGIMIKQLVDDAGIPAVFLDSYFYQRLM